jgi:glucose uptake protein
MILTMLCWGSWANTQKLSGKWRFELFYFDYSLGVFLAAVVLAFTFGTLGPYGPSALDDLSAAGGRQMLFGLLGGVVFNLANMLLVAAISIAGLSVAFPIGIGLALIIGVIWNYAIDPVGSPVLLFTGAAVVAVAIVIDAMAYRAFTGAKQVTAKGIAVSLLSGVLMGSFYPIVQLGVYRPGGNEAGLGPYSMGLIFSGGVFLSTFVFNLFFMRFPVEGRPIEMREYLTGTSRQHVLGLVGGTIWSLGTIANFVAARAQGEARVGPAVSYAIGQGATMVSVLWGLIYWKEFSGAGPRVRLLITLMLIAFIAGLAMVSIAPLFG